MYHKTQLLRAAPAFYPRIEGTATFLKTFKTSSSFQIIMVRTKWIPGRTPLDRADTVRKDILSESNRWHYLMRKSRRIPILPNII